MLFFILRLIHHQIEFLKSFDEEKGESSSLEIHMPNRLEYDVLRIDIGLTHDYDKCLIKSSNFYDYNCVDDFCE